MRIDYLRVRIELYGRVFNCILERTICVGVGWLDTILIIDSRAIGARPVPSIA